MEYFRDFEGLSKKGERAVYQRCLKLTAHSPLESCIVTKFYIVGGCHVFIVDHVGHVFFPETVGRRQNPIRIDDGPCAMS